MRPIAEKPEQGQQRAVGCLARLTLAGYPLNNYSAGIWAKATMLSGRAVYVLAPLVRHEVA
jgi:hypothetical protein